MSSFISLLIRNVVLSNLRGVVVLPDPRVHLVVGDRAPERRLAVHHRLQVHAPRRGGVRGGQGGRGHQQRVVLHHVLALRGGVPVGVLGEVAGGGDGGRGGRAGQVTQAVTEQNIIKYICNIKKKK